MSIQKMADIVSWRGVLGVRKNSGSRKFSPYLRVYGQDLDKIKEVFGGWQKNGVWEANGMRAEVILRLIYPYLTSQVEKTEKLLSCSSQEDYADFRAEFKGQRRRRSVPDYVTDENYRSYKELEQKIIAAIPKWAF